MGIYKEFKRSGRVKTQAGICRVKCVLHKKNPENNLYKIECPIGRGECIFSIAGIKTAGVNKCPYCNKHNILAGGKAGIAAIEEAALREALNRPARSVVAAGGNWRVVRYEALKRANGRCILCGRSAKDGVKLHVDHIKPASLFPELYFDINNLQVLCEDCNLGKSDTDSIDWRNSNDKT